MPPFSPPLLSRLSALLLHKPLPTSSFSGLYPATSCVSIVIELYSACFISVTRAAKLDLPAASSSSHIIKLKRERKAERPLHTPSNFSTSRPSKPPSFSTSSRRNHARDKGTLAREYVPNEDTERLIAMLRVMVLHGGPPESLTVDLPPPLQQIVQDGARLRARSAHYFHTFFCLAFSEAATLNKRNVVVIESVAHEMGAANNSIY